MPLPAQIESLPALGADLQRVTVSGVSSGAYMANQLHVAYSDRIRGAGMVAGGPFGCSAGITCRALTRCMKGTAPPVERLWARAMDMERLNKIAPLVNLKSSRVYIARGGQDDTIGQAQTDALFQFYRLAGIPKSEIFTACLGGGGCSLANHALVTPDGPRACGEHAHPYLNRCGSENQPDEILRWLYPEKQPWHPPGSPSRGRWVAFDQERASGVNTGAYGLATVGYLYVPAACERDSCPVHVALHGCAQSEAVLRTNDSNLNRYLPPGQAREDNSFVRDAGYSASAAANNLIILYPQAEPSGYRIYERPIFPDVRENPLNVCSNLIIAASPAIYGYNPKGCWDWWGYTRLAYLGGNEVYLTQGAEQMKAIIKMLDRLGEPRNLEF